MVKRFNRKITALPSLLLFIAIYFTVKLTPFFSGVYSFLGDSIIMASLAVIAALHGLGLGILTAFLMSFLDTWVLSSAAIIFLTGQSARATSLLTAMSFFQSFGKGITVAGMVGIIVDTPEKIGRTAIWTYVSLLIYQVFFGAILGDIDYFLDTILPRAALELIASSLLTIVLIFPYSIPATYIDKIVSTKVSRKAGENLSYKTSKT